MRTRSRAVVSAHGPLRRSTPARPPAAGSAAGTVLELFVLAPEPAAEAAVLLASFRTARVLASFPRRGGEAGARWQRIIRLHERTLGVLEGRKGGRPAPSGRELREFGSDLFEALFPGEVRRLYDEARSSRKAGALSVVFTSMIDWVADKPWELAFDRSRRAFLATTEVNFVRNAFTAVPADDLPPRAGRLRILIAAAQPAGLDPLAVRREIAGIRKGLASLEKAGLAAVDVLERATPEKLQRRLVDASVEVLHFVGHGVFDAEARSGRLIFEDGLGREKLVDASSFRQIVGGRGLRLVFLNACESGRGGRTDFNRGVAPALVAAGLPAVVANQYPVLDEAALAFAGSVYWALAHGLPLGDAVREARIALASALGAESIEWGVPVVFARDPGLVLRRKKRT